MIRALFASFVVSVAAVGGYCSDVVIDKWNTDVAALVAWYNYDAEAEYWTCHKINAGNCTDHMQAWIARDGRDVVMKEILTYGLVNIGGALQNAKPERFSLR